MDPITASALASQAGTVSQQVPPTVDALAPIIHDLAQQNANQQAQMIGLAKEGASFAKDAASGAAAMAERQVNRIGIKEIMLGFIGIIVVLKIITKPAEDAAKAAKDAIASIAGAPAATINAAGGAVSGAIGTTFQGISNVIHTTGSTALSLLNGIQGDDPSPGPGIALKGSSVAKWHDLLSTSATDANIGLFEAFLRTPEGQNLKRAMVSVSMTYPALNMLQILDYLNEEMN